MLRLTTRANLPPPNSRSRIHHNPNVQLLPTSIAHTNPIRQNLTQFTLHHPNNNGLPPGGNSNNNGGSWNWEDDDRHEVSFQEPRLNPSGCVELPIDHNPAKQIGFAVMRVLYDFCNSIAVSTADAFALVGYTLIVVAVALACFLFTLL